MLNLLSYVWWTELGLNCIALTMVFATPNAFLAGFAPQHALQSQGYDSLFSPASEGLLYMWGALLLVLTYSECRAVLSGSPQVMSIVLQALLVGDFAHFYASYKLAEQTGGWSQTNVIGVVITAALAAARVAWFTQNQPIKAKQ